MQVLPSVSHVIRQVLPIVPCHVQCVVKDDPDTGKRVVAGTHWDFDSYGGTIKKKLGMPTQVGAKS